MAKVKPRVRVPKKVSKGEIFEIKTLVSHKMESGQRKDKKSGKKIPRKIINKFECKYNGETVFSADWHPAVSANPYMSFHTVATESGEVELTWTDDDGSIYSKKAKINVS